MMNPYLHATPMQKFATEWFIMGRYIKLLLYPYPLCFDYSYAYYQLVYRNLTDILVLLSIATYLAAFVWGIWLALKKNVLAFAVFFFLVNLMMVSNFFLYIGATMGERLAFHSSLGFVIILSYYFLKVISKQKLVLKRIVVFGIASVLSLVCLAETVQRNAEWCDNNTLFIHDVIVAPNSTWANNNTGWSYLGKSESKDNTAEQAARYVDSAYKYILKAIREDTTYSAAFGNLGGVYFHKAMYDSAKYYWDESVRLSHGSHIPVAQYKLLSNVFYEKGMELGKKGDAYGGIRELRKAASVADSNADIWYNLGGAYYSVKNYDSARYAWEKTLKLRPNDVNAKQGLQAIPQSNR
jgi:tetratricopeptide (TPR) repeat protein